MPRAGFSIAAALLRAFDAVPDRVPHQMRERLRDGIQQALVEGGVLPVHNQFDLLATLLSDVPNHAGKAAEQLLDRNHADFHHRALQIIQHPGLKCHGIGEASAHRFLGIARGEFVERLLQHGFADNQFAHEIEHGIDPLRIHAQHVFAQRQEFGLATSLAIRLEEATLLRSARLRCGCELFRAASSALSLIGSFSRQ